MDERVRPLSREELEAIVARRTQQLRDRTEALERSHRELEAFAYAAAHDLHEPLRGVTNLAGFLREDYANALAGDGLSTLDEIDKLCARLRTKVTRLLQFSEAGHVAPRVRTADLECVLDAVLLEERMRVRERGAEVRRPGRLPHVRCDARRVAEVLRQLIRNALTFSDADAPWIEIGCRQRTIYVRDNGIGIDPAHHDQVFELFRRLHAPEAFGGGAGAGLSLARKLLESQGGRLWVDSEPGAGATFAFEFCAAAYAFTRGIRALPVVTRADDPTPSAGAPSCGERAVCPALAKGQDPGAVDLSTVCDQVCDLGLRLGATDLGRDWLLSSEPSSASSL